MPATYDDDRYKAERDAERLLDTTEAVEANWYNAAPIRDILNEYQRERKAEAHDRRHRRLKEGLFQAACDLAVFALFVLGLGALFVLGQFLIGLFAPAAAL